MSSKQTTINSYFTAKKTTTHVVTKPVEIPKKASKMAKMLVREKYEIDGEHLNIPDTWEHGIHLTAAPQEYTEKNRRIILWGSIHHKFDSSVFKSIGERAVFKKGFSSKERYAIDRVYYKCKVFKMF
jgi:hypothetical protein